MANDELDALDALEKEAKEYDKVGQQDSGVFPLLPELMGIAGCRD